MSSVKRIVAADRKPIIPRKYYSVEYNAKKKAFADARLERFKAELSKSESVKEAAINCGVSPNAMSCAFRRVGDCPKNYLIGRSQ